jgi:hypothetical protein
VKVAKDTERIEQEIEAARERLASTLDEIAVRADPQRLAEGTKQLALAKVNQPKVKYTLIGVGVLAAGALLFKILR